MLELLIISNKNNHWIRVINLRNNFFFIFDFFFTHSKDSQAKFISKAKFVLAIVI